MLQRQSGLDQQEIPQRSNPHRFAEPPVRGHKGLAVPGPELPAHLIRACSGGQGDPEPDRVVVGVLETQIQRFHVLQLHIGRQ